MRLTVHSSIFLIFLLLCVAARATPVNHNIKRDEPVSNWNKPSCDKNDNNKRDVVMLTNDKSGDDCVVTTTTTTPTATATAKPTSHSTPTSLPASDDPAVIYGGRGVTPQMGVAGAIFIILGIYLMVFGFRAFRPTLGVCGFITFGIVTWVGMANSQPANGYINEPITLIAVPAGLGVLGAILYVFFWNVSIYLVGGLGGLALALYICCWKENLLIVQEVARACFLVALPFFMACITFFVERYVILFSTSFVGAYIFILGVDFLAHTGYLAGIRSILDRNPLHRVRYTITRTVIAMLAVTIVLFLISLAWQYLYNRNRHFGVNIVPVKAAPPPAAEEAGEAEAPPAEGAGEGEPPKA